MGLQDLLFWRPRNQELLSELAGQIAGGSLEAIWRRVYPRLPELSSIEARGYVRARSRVLVYRQVHHAISQQPQLSGYEAKLAEMAIDTLTQLVLAQWRAMQPVFISIPALRRAA